jgi:hypothetical protein
LINCLDEARVVKQRLRLSPDLPVLDYSFQWVEFIDSFGREITLNVLVLVPQYIFQQ